MYLRIFGINLVYLNVVKWMFRTFCSCSSETYELRLLLLQHTRINRHAVERTHGWLRIRQVLYSLVQYWIFARPLLRRLKRLKDIVVTQMASLVHCLGNVFSWCLWWGDACSSEMYELCLLLLQHTRINQHTVERTHGWLRTRQVLYSLVQCWIFARPLLRKPKRLKDILATQTASQPLVCVCVCVWTGGFGLKQKKASFMRFRCKENGSNPQMILGLTGPSSETHYFAAFEKGVK